MMMMMMYFLAASEEFLGAVYNVTEEIHSRDSHFSCSDPVVNLLTLTRIKPLPQGAVGRINDCGLVVR